MTAQDAYASAHAQALDLLNTLRDRLEDMDAPSERTHWGHVGDITALVAQLRAIADPEGSGTETDCRAEATFAEDGTPVFSEEAR